VCGESKLSDGHGLFLQYVLLIRRTHLTEVLVTYERVGVAVLLDTHTVPGTTKVWVVREWLCIFGITFCVLNFCKCATSCLVVILIYNSYLRAHIYLEIGIVVVE
jgi:hypothetical protein